MFIKGLISGRFGHKHSHLKKGTVYFRFGYITRWDTIAFHHHSGTSFHTTLNHKYLMSHHVINCSSTKFDNPWIVAKNWYIRQKFEFLFKCCQSFTAFGKHHTIENTYVQMWFIEQTQEMSQKIQTRWFLEPFSKWEVCQDPILGH